MKINKFIFEEPRQYTISTRDIRKVLKELREHIEQCLSKCENRREELKYFGMLNLLRYLEKRLKEYEYRIERDIQK
jgi:hypothetical protein